MTVTLAPPPSHFTLVLDTTPYPLEVSRVDQVSPPDELVLAVTTADEAVLTAWLTDSLGTIYSVSPERDGAGHWATLRLPTVGVAQGPALLHVEATDDVGNVTVSEQMVGIDRPRAFDVVLDESTAFDVEHLHTAAYDVGTVVARAYDVEITVTEEA